MALPTNTSHSYVAEEMVLERSFRYCRRFDHGGPGPTTEHRACSSHGLCLPRQHLLGHPLGCSRGNLHHPWTARPGTRQETPIVLCRTSGHAQLHSRATGRTGNHGIYQTDPCGHEPRIGQPYTSHRIQLDTVHLVLPLALRLYALRAGLHHGTKTDKT